MKKCYILVTLSCLCLLGIDSLLLSIAEVPIVLNWGLKAIVVVGTLLLLYFSNKSEERQRKKLREENAHLRSEISKITEMKTRLTAKKVKLNNKRLFIRQLLDNASQFIIWMDKDLIIRGVNNRLISTFNVKNEQDIIGKRLIDFYPGQDEEFRRLSELYNQVMQTGEPILKYPFDFHSIITKQSAWLELNISPIIQNDEIVGVLSCSSYITERVKAEQMKEEHQEKLTVLVEERTKELEQKNQEIHALLDKLQSRNLELEEIVAKRTEKLKEFNEELTRSNNDLQQFAYMASHDLQEPLRIVSNFLSLLRRRYKDDIDETGHEYINFAVDGAKRMSQLISSLLDYSRVGRKENGYQNANLNNTLELKLLDLSQVISEKNVKVNLEPLPQNIYCERNQIGMVFYNLINNGIKFNKAEQPVIEIKSHDDAPEGFWKFSVSDNGIGISDEYKEQVFEVFRRLHSKKDYPGTGIGLALCQKIVNRHGGKIWLESEPNQGTTFFFTIDKHIEAKLKAKEEEDSTLEAVNN